MAQTPGQSPKGKLRIGEVLVQEGLLSEAQLKKALIEQQSSGRPLGEMLMEQGVINNATLVQMLARTLGIPGCQLQRTEQAVHRMTQPIRVARGSRSAPPSGWIG